MKNFKEWVSDYLRYFMLILAVVLICVIGVFVYRIFRGTSKPAQDEPIEILTEEARLDETESETGTEAQTETETETEEETESESEGNTQENQSEAAGQTEAGTGEASQSVTEGRQSEVQTEAQTEAQTETAAPETDPPYEPVYMSLNQACNLRSGPGYDYDVITSYSAGTVVEFRGMVEGWAEVQVDGMIGYMGRQFLG